MKTMYHFHPMPVWSSSATLVVCPIIVLNAKLVIVAILTPLDLVFVSNISAGMIQLSGPHVALNEKLYNHVATMKPHAADPVPDSPDPGGNLASSTVAAMKVTMLPKLPRISGHRRPV
jgi:hypothetical protein